MSITSETRICTVHSPLGEDALILDELSAHEYVSGLFEFSARFTSEDLEIDLGELLGQNVCIEARLGEGEPRYFNGIVSRFTQQDDDISNNVYHAEIVPWLWLTTRSTNCRIFQEKTVIEVIEEVFADLNLTDYELETSGSYEPIPYCVQYRESDFNFVSRLMESAGIAYYFKHELKLHTMVLFDSPSANADCPDQAEATYVGHADEEEGTAGLVLSWSVERELRSGLYSHTDYNYTDPSLDLATEQEANNAVEAASGLELYDYPGEYAAFNSGESIAKIRIEAEELASHTIAGESTCCGFSPGYKFALIGHYRSSFDDTYLLTDVHHTVSQPVGNKEGTSSYTNSFHCTPHALPYRPPRRAKKPVIQGMQPAKVVSSEGKDIDVDEYGRVLVRFPWDRAENGASCRVRVSQNWAGKTWGGMFFPHVDQEVLVSFLEGDPDCPIVAGRVYNALHMPPQNPVANATKSIIRDHGGNEIIMEGADGSQRISMYSPHGETKFNMGAPNSPGPGFTLETALEQFVSVGGNVTEWFKADENRTVDGSTTRQIQGDETNSTTGKKKAEVKGQLIHMNASIKSENTIGATHSTFVGGQLGMFYGYKHDINRGWKKTVDSATVVQEAGNKTFSSKANYKIDCGDAFIVDASGEIELKCGSSTILIHPGGIDIVADEILLNGKSGNVAITASSDIGLSPSGKVNIPKGKLNDKTIKSL
jgi:type VI secretion system secreted protein VgrG